MLLNESNIPTILSKCLDITEVNLRNRLAINTSGERLYVVREYISPSVPSFSGSVIIREKHFMKTFSFENGYIPNRSWFEVEPNER